jgi:hypothetical protein
MLHHCAGQTWIFSPKARDVMPKIVDLPEMLRSSCGGHGSTDLKTSREREKVVRSRGRLRRLRTAFAYGQRLQAQQTEVEQRWKCVSGFPQCPGGCK